MFHLHKINLLVGTAVSTLIACSAVALAQSDTGATPIAGISKAAGGATAAAKAPIKIPLKSTYSQSVISKQVIENASPATIALHTIGVFRWYLCATAPADQ